MEAVLAGLAQVEVSRWERERELEMARHDPVAAASVEED